MFREEDNLWFCDSGAKISRSVEEGLSVLPSRLSNKYDYIDFVDGDWSLKVNTGTKGGIRGFVFE